MNEHKHWTRWEDWTCSESEGGDWAAIWETELGSADNAITSRSKKRTSELKKLGLVDEFVGEEDSEIQFHWYWNRTKPLQVGVEGNGCATIRAQVARTTILGWKRVEQHQWLGEECVLDRYNFLKGGDWHVSWKKLNLCCIQGGIHNA